MDKNQSLQNLLNGTALEEDVALLKRLLASGEISIGGNVNQSVIIIGSGNTVELPPAALDRLNARSMLGNLDRDVTSEEIASGLRRLDKLLPNRAPVLLPHYKEQVGRLRPSLKTEIKALSETARRERVEALAAINSICVEALDVSFNGLCLGEEAPKYDARSPFRGLESFRLEESEFFFGREALTQKLIEKIKAHSFLAVLGASGSGKSSLVMAGVIPVLASDYIVFRPGTNPLGELESARGKGLIVVDQFEELFTLTRDESIREEFIARLLNESSRARIIITLRSDFLGEVGAHRALSAEIQNHLEIIPPMDMDELRRAMEGQAGVVGLRFEADLSQQILDDVAGEPGAMPLLQHALWELWNRRHGRNLRASEYRAFGGVKQAITNTAEKVYAECSKPEQDQVRDIFLRLTRLDDSDEGRDTRRRVPVSNLILSERDTASITLLLDKLANARLTVKTVNEDKIEEVEVAHEALIRHWERLRLWLNEDRDALRLRESVSEDAKEWEKSGKHETLFNSRWVKLDEALLLIQDSRYQLTEIEQLYLKGCVGLRNREQRERERRLRYTVFASIAAAVVFFVLGAFGLVKSNESNANAQKAENNAATAQAASTHAVEQKLEAEIKSRIARSGELSGLALDYQESNLPLSNLLSIEAYNVMDTDSSRSSLFKLLYDNYRLKHFFFTEDDQQFAVAFHPEGKIFASSGTAGDILFWDLKTRKLIDRLDEVHTSTIDCLVFNPDGITIASASNEKIVILDFHTKETVQEISFDGVNSIAYNNDGALLAAISENEIKIWETVNYSLIFSKGKEAAKFSTGFAFSPDGDKISFGDQDNNVYLLSLQEEKADWLFKQENDADCMAFDPTGKLLAICSYNKINLWNIGDYELLETPLLGHAERIISIVYKYDGERLYSAGWDGSIIRWNMNEYSQQGSELHGHTRAVRDLEISPDGKDLISAGGEYVILWDIWNVSENPINSLENDVTALDIGKDKSLLATGTDDGQVYVWDITERARLLSAFSSNTQPVLDIEFALDDQILVFSDKGNEITIVNLESQEIIRQIWGSSAETVFGDFNPIAISPDGRTLLRIDENGEVDLIDVLSQESKGSMQSCSSGSILAADFSPNGKYVAVSTWSELCVWDISTSEEVKLSQSQDLYNAWDIAFSPNSSKLAVVNSEEILIWETDNWSRSGEPLVDDQRSQSFNAPLRLSFSSDSTFLTASYFSKILVWDMRTHQIFGTTIVVTPDYGKIEYSPDGRYLYSGGAGTSYAGNVYVYDMQPENWITTLCDKVGRNFTELEWEIYFPGEDYRATCKQWSLEIETTSTVTP